MSRKSVPTWFDLAGKTIAAFRGDPKGYFYILFDDGKTVLHLRPQDPYGFHDCNPCARSIDLSVDASQWQLIEKTERTPTAAELGTHPFD